MQHPRTSSKITGNMHIESFEILIDKLDYTIVIKKRVENSIDKKKFSIEKGKWKINIDSKELEKNIIENKSTTSTSAIDTDKKRTVTSNITLENYSTISQRRDITTPTRYTTTSTGWTIDKTIEMNIGKIGCEDTIDIMIIMNQDGIGIRFGMISSVENNEIGNKTLHSIDPSQLDVSWMTT